ncbi:MAG: hypothetical protein K6G24_07050 [Lachnospiraceae bacterium]|nr:hypothetical protein [Lachnospiraceae bacterium]
MKIALGEKVNYYSECPNCGSARTGTEDSCRKCGKSLIKTVEKANETEEDDGEVSLYKVREEKSASENFKELKGKAKFNYFKDYYLGKIILALIIVGLLGSLVYTFLKPKQEPVLYIAMVVSPFLPDAQKEFQADLTKMFVTDDVHENIMLDTNYSSLVADYNSMMSYTMHLSAGEIDMVILTKDELKYQVNNGVIIPVKEAVSSDLLDKIDDSLKYKVTPAKLLENGDAEYGEEDVYGLNLEKFLEKKNGFETSNKYVLAFVSIAPHKEKFDSVVKYIFDVG